MIRNRDLPLLELREGGWSPCLENRAEPQELVPQQGIGPWSLAVYAGDSVCIEGPSGTGKTLLLQRLCQTPLAGLQAEGQLFWCGEPAPASGKGLQQWWQHQIRLVPQDVQSALSPCLRIGQQLRIAFKSSPLRLRGWQLNSLLEILELADRTSTHPCPLLERFPCQCSGGQRQRIGLLLGLLAAPHLLLLDEPSSALHASLAQRLPDIVAELLPSTSCIWTTHDPILKASLQAAGVGSIGLLPPPIPMRCTASPSAPVSCSPVSCSPVSCSPVPSALTVSCASSSSTSSSPALSESQSSTLLSPPRIAQAIQRCIGGVESLQVPLSHDLALRVADRTILGGQIIGWWGPSGIGKTSLARCVAGLLAPQSGRVWIETSNGAEPTETSLSCFLAFQNAFACFLPHRSLRQQLQEALAYRRPCADTRELESLWAEFDLPISQLDAPPTALSGGQLQRAALIRALLLRPTLLVLDEPTAALDPVNRIRVANALRRYVDNGHRSVCIISHDQAWLASLADELWDLQEGACR